ncbi:hypothetical protein B0H16DRAFT_1724379 [Mycena metata]|uniref:Uncharacterized protein n=1 Tax=Mycena metata TaxID=1033252 RepID=A0AAD7IWN9_9AGAR|nr:hypothetical protein B0H16DRAFT_1724379 [Mycena metata]
MENALSLANQLLRDVPALANNPTFNRLRDTLSRSPSLSPSIQSSRFPASGSVNQDGEDSDNDPFGGDLADLSPPPSPRPTQDDGSPSGASPSSSTKRKRALDDDGPEEEEETYAADRRRSPRKHGTAAVPVQAGPMIGVRGKGGKGGKGGSSCEQRNAKGKSTVRMKDRTDRMMRLRGGLGSETPPADRVPGALRGTAGDDDCDDGSDGDYANSSSPSKGRNKMCKPTSFDLGTPPKTPLTGGQLLTRISLVTSQEGQQYLADFISALISERETICLPAPKEDIHSLRSVVEIGKRGQVMLNRNALEDFHILLMHLRFRLAAHNSGLLQKDMASQIGVGAQTINKWMAKGTKVAYLAGGGTFYFLILVCAMRLAGKILNDDFPLEVVYSLANALKDPHERFLGWFTTHVLETVIRIPKGDCATPDDPQAAKEWVERQRLYAENGKRVESIKELHDELNALHINGLQDGQSYIRFDTAICKGDALVIKGISDHQEKDVALVLTDMLDVLGADYLDSLPHLINAALGDGLLEQDSRTEGFTIEALHLEPAYNRYTEKVSPIMTSPVLPVISFRVKALLQTKSTLIIYEENMSPVLIMANGFPGLPKKLPRTRKHTPASSMSLRN